MILKSGQVGDTINGVIFLAGLPLGRLLQWEEIGIISRWEIITRQGLKTHSWTRSH
jgi:hypothetical protein